MKGAGRIGLIALLRRSVVEFANAMCRFSQDARGDDPVTPGARGGGGEGASPAGSPQVLDGIVRKFRTGVPSTRPPENSCAAQNVNASTASLGARQSGRP